MVVTWSQTAGRSGKHRGRRPRHAGASLAAILALTLSAPPGLAHEDAAEVHNRAIILDTHVDIPLNWATDGLDPSQETRWQVDLPKMRAGGMDAAFFVVYVPQGPRTPAGHAEAISTGFARLAAIRRMTDDLARDSMGLAVSAYDVVRLHREGKHAALIGIENGYALGGNIDLLDIYYDYGVRYLGLTHNGHNELADSAIPKPEYGDEAELHGGLSELGRAAIRRANALGVIVDISHASMETTLQAAALSQAPIIASHSSVASLRPHPRNLTDEALKAIAETGGVVNIVAFDTYLHEVDEEKFTSLLQIRQDMGLSMEWVAQASEEDWQTYRARVDALNAKYPLAHIDALLDHIDYAVNLIGIDHVGIASDFGGGGGIDGWTDASETPALTQGLLGRGYNAQEIDKLLGGNMLRVLTTVERLAQKPNNTQETE